MSVVPLVVLLYFLFYGLLIRATLGRWPVVFQDQIDTGVWEVLDSGAAYLATVLVLIFWPWGTFLVVMSFRRSALIRRYLKLWALGLLAVALTIAGDPTGFVEWWLD